jgi:hypothetical protein
MQINVYIPKSTSHTRMRLESQQALPQEIEAITTVEDEPCPQRVAALCPEARKVEQSHDGVRLERASAGP